MANIYDLQKQGASIKVKPATPGVLPVQPKVNISANMPGLTQVGPTPAPAPAKKVLNINDLQTKGVPIVKKTPEQPSFVREVATDIVGDTIQSAGNVANTVMQPFGAAIQYGADKIKGNNPTWKGSMEKAKQISEQGVELNGDSQIGNKLPPGQKPGILYDAMKKYPTQVRDLTTGKGIQQFTGDVAKTALNATMFLPTGPAGAAAKTLKTGVSATAKKLAKEGAVYGAGYGFGQAMQDNKDTLGVVGETALGGVIGAGANLALGGVVGGLSKGLAKTLPGYAERTVPGRFQSKISESQKNLDRTLDYITDPSVVDVNIPSYVKSNIEYTRSRFPNLQEEVAIRSGKPIKTVNDKGTIKFQTGEQAQIIENKAYAESDAASELAKKFDPVADPVTSKEMVEKLDGILSTSGLPNTAEVRDQALKILANDFRGVKNGEMPVSFADKKRVEAGQKSNKYDPTKGLVNDTDAYDVLRKAWKEVLSQKIRDPQYLTSIQNASDNFEIARLLKNLHNREAIATRSTLSKATTNTGKGIKYVGSKIPFNLGGTIEMLGDIIKAIPEVTSSERALMSKAIEKLVAKAKDVGAKITDSETRVLNFIKRLEQSNAKGEPVEISSGIINELRNLEHTKQTEEARKFFNKQFGEEFITNTSLDLADTYDKFQKANAKGKGDILTKLYKDLLDETRGLNKKTLPKATQPEKVDNFLNTPIKEVKNTDMETLRANQEKKAAEEEARFYGEQAQPTDYLTQIETTGATMKKEELIQTLRDLAKDKYEQEMSLEFAKQGFEDKATSDLGRVSRKELARIAKVTGNTVTDYASKSAVGKKVMRGIEDIQGMGDKDAQEVIDEVASFYDLKQEVADRKEFVRQTKDKYNNTVKDLKAMGLSDKAIKNISSNFYGGIAGIKVNEDGTVEYDPEAGAAGMALFSGSTALRDKYGDKIAADIAKKFSDISGELLAEGLKKTGTRGGLSDWLLSKIKTEDYKYVDMKISDILKDKDFAEYVNSSNGKIRPYSGKEAQTPPIVTSTGEVWDGYNRIAQAIKNGDETIKVAQGVDLSQKTPKDLYPDLTKKQMDTLIAVHNTTESKLYKANKLGGYANPSIAIFDPNKHSFDNFGDITLISPKDLITSKGAKTFSADAYTPRFPKTETFVDWKKFDAMKEKYGLKDSRIESSDFYNTAEYDPNVRKAFLENTGVDTSKMEESDIRDMVNKKTPEFLDFISTLANESGIKEKIFKGFTYSGTRRYSDANIQNISKDMNSGELRGGEGFMQGLATIRSRITPQLKGIKDIKKNSWRLTSTEDFTKSADEYTKKLDDISEKMVDYAKYKDNNYFSLRSNVMENIGEYMKGDKKVMTDFFDNVPPETIKEIDDFAKLLVQMPTEYFETKFKRPVSLNEFSHAIVPEDISPATVKTLEDKGVTVVKYNKEKGSQMDTLKKLANEYGLYLGIAAGVGSLSAVPNSADAMSLSNSGEVKASVEDQKRNNDAADKIFNNGKIDKNKIGDVLHNIEGNKGKADFTGYAGTRVAKIPDNNGKTTDFKYKVGKAKEFGITPMAIAQLIKEKRYSKEGIQTKLMTTEGAKEVATAYFMRGLDPNKEYSVNELADHYVKNYVTSASPFFDKKSMKAKIIELLREIQK